jgi:hypothetical protein
MITRRYAAQAVLLEDGTVLMAGGTGGQPVNAFAGAELYDPRTNSWSRTGSLNFPRTRFTATRLLDGRVLAVGGVNGMNTALKSAEIYDPATRTWRVVAAPASPRFNHSAVLLPSGKVMVMGGGDTQPGGPTLSSSEIYDPAADTWTPGPGMTVEREAFAASLLPTGGVLAVGGDDDLNRQLSSAEILSADGLTWTPAPEMAARRNARRPPDW